eukprot:573780-Prymnesium_polylepis.1
MAWHGMAWHGMAWHGIAAAIATAVAAIVAAAAAVVSARAAWPLNASFTWSRASHALRQRRREGQAGRARVAPRRLLDAARRKVGLDLA